MTEPKGTLRVAVLVETSSAYGRGLIRGLSEYSRQNPELVLQLEETGPIRVVPGWLSQWTGHGLIARVETSEIAQELLAKNVPIVNVAGRRLSESIPHVDTDNRGIAELAVGYFVRRRFLNYAYLGSVGSDWAQWRKRALEDVLRSHRKTLFCFEQDGGEPGKGALGEWLRSLPKPVALLACNDRFARMVLDVCLEEGLGVPDEVAVLGVDNDEVLCTVSRPQLSSITPDAEAIGFQALATLYRLMRGEEVGALQHWIAPLSIEARESTDTTATEDWVVRQALRFIHGNALGEIGVGDVVGRVGVSRRLLEQRFRKVLGRPIHEEIFRVRLQEAQRLLSGTELPLKDVALRSGFKRADYLSVVFREKLGMTPGEYRQKRS